MYHLISYVSRYDAIDDKRWYLTYIMRCERIIHETIYATIRKDKIRYDILWYMIWLLYLYHASENGLFSLRWWKCIYIYLSFIRLWFEVNHIDSSSPASFSASPRLSNRMPSIHLFVCRHLLRRTFTDVLLSRFVKELLQDLGSCR